MWTQVANTYLSSSSQVFPLLVTIAILAGIAFVLYQIYLSVAKIQENATKQMDKRNVVFTKDGVKVGIRHVGTEKYVDETQSYLVKAWNLGNDAKQEEKK